MILADKIIRLRRQKGWSQEELAERMGVSRQAVSKWEGGQAMPDLEKILILSELFGVSTDHLLKNDIEDAEAIDDLQSDEAPPRRVSADEACEYLKLRRGASWRIALATLLCILSPIAVILFSTAQEAGILPISEGLAGGLGVVILFLFVIAAIPFYIYCGIKSSAYKFLEDGTPFTVDAEVEAMLRAELQALQGRYIAYNIVATCLCVASPIPVIVAAFTERELLVVCMVCVTLAVVSAAVFLYIVVGVRQASLQKLLREGDFAPKEQRKKSVAETVGAIYWPILVAAYLAWSFIGNAWGISWVIFPVGAAVFAAIEAILRLTVDRNK